MPETRIEAVRTWRGLRLYVCARGDDGLWSWDYCPDCGKRGAHHGVGVRCG